jgi:hypothetical protein
MIKLTIITGFKMFSTLIRIPKKCVLMATKINMPMLIPKLKTIVSGISGVFSNRTLIKE